ncbi:MAG: HAD-IG family 5'-nucleotidase [Deltaproteobacteria bacterium]|nr:HAD-IG family 5'-nucleotidase [Deltaproteobacteria bacterium]
MIAPPPAEREIFCNRTLNLRSIKAIGYDMDYTLIHYHVEQWEGRAYDYLRDRLHAAGLPVSDLRFDHHSVIRGLVIDTELGNIVKANRFGYVKQAWHGTRPLDYDSLRSGYARTIVDLTEPRFIFANTLFSLCELSMYAQLVDLVDQRKLDPSLGYGNLYPLIKQSLDAAHMEGQLKAEIVDNPSRFVADDPDTVAALLDQKRAGKRLLLITNSEWPYTEAMMSYAFDPHLPGSMRWGELFDVIIVSARKPAFFSQHNPVFEIINSEGHLKPVVGSLGHGIYLGGDAWKVEQYLGLSGDDILYVGDHIWGDVHVSKRLLRWRTALILRELEGEVAANQAFSADQQRLAEMMSQKRDKEFALSQLRLARLRAGKSEPNAQTEALRTELIKLDNQISPLARASGKIGNETWGPLLRTGNDKSLLARMVERHADIYTSRVSNFLFQTPFAYLRSPRGSMPHDPGQPIGG